MSPFLVLALIVIAVGLTFTGCSVHARLETKPATVVGQLPFEDRVEAYSTVLSTAELFQQLDNFEAFSFFYRPPTEYREYPSLSVTVRFDSDVYLGVTEFQLEENNVEQLKLNLQQLFEEIRNAQEQRRQRS